MDNTSNQSNSDFQQEFIKNVETSVGTDNTPATSPTKASLPKWPLIVAAVAILALIGMVVTLIFINKDNNTQSGHSKLYCTNNEEVQITISFNDNELLEYSATDVPFDFEDQKTRAKIQGTEYTMMEYAQWFENHVQDGHCEMQ